jgi:glycosyltransferase involved in cell wall biosynthesis
MLTILSVASPCATVSRDSGAAAEQTIWQLDQAIRSAGHRTLVLAAEGSSIAGQLIPTAGGSTDLLPRSRSQAQARHRQAIDKALREHSVDLVHMHGVDFDTYLPGARVPVLVTLHCPLHRYARTALAPRRARTWLVPVSAQQRRKLRADRVLDPIEPGVMLSAFAGSYDKRGFALMLGRLSPDKGVHLALDAADAAGVRLTLAGDCPLGAEHKRYFDDEIKPRLDTARRWIGPVSLAVKRRLLGEAHCLMVCSEDRETSPLAAREALAAGTPVVGFAGTAMQLIVESGRTGILVARPQDLGDAIARAAQMDAQVCRRAAWVKYDSRAMCRDYLRLYASLVETAARDDIPSRKPRRTATAHP